MKEIGKIFPPNILPLEINSDHSERLRGLIVDCTNPIQSAADTNAYLEAFEKLDLLVVIDVAMSETAEQASYILPAPTQYEKWEASFFNWSFPTNYFYLRQPIMEPEGDTLPEPEIYFRLAVAMGVIPDSFPDLLEAAQKHREAPEKGIFPIAFQTTMMKHPQWQKYAPLILYATLGKVLPGGAQAAAVLWGSAQFYAQRFEKQVQRAGHEGEGFLLGENLFNAILEADTHVPISTHTYEESWQLIKHRDGKIHLPIPEMLDEWKALENEEMHPNPEYPYILASGERRDYNANQIMRDPNWRRTDKEGALRIHPDDAAALGVGEGAQLLCQSERGAIEVVATMDDRQRPGFVSLPHGYGMSYPNLQDEEMVQHGPRLNLITSSLHCDPVAKTPYHKYVPVQLRPVGVAAD